MTTRPDLSDDLLAARAGDRRAFAALVRAHQRLAFGIALRLLAQRAEADEVAQEAFLRLYRQIATIESDAHLRAWLVRVTTHLAIDRLRQRPEQPDCTLDTVELAAVEDPSDPLLASTLRRLLATLPTAARAVLLLRYQQDLDPTDIAHTLDMPLNTVKSHLKRSLDHLRQRLRGQAPVLGEPLDER